MEQIELFELSCSDLAATDASDAIDGRTGRAESAACRARGASESEAEVEVRVDMNLDDVWVKGSE